VAGAALHEVEGWEGARGDWAGWALIIFGGLYAAWGVVRALRGKAHGHVHLHHDGQIHRHGHEHGGDEGHPSVHEHGHEQEHGDGHGHGHGDERGRGAPTPWKSLTPWLLFLIFVLGPCEPLIPMFFASAVAGNWTDVAMVTLGYTAATLFGMHLLVTVFWFSLKRVSLGPIERWGNAMAGGVILLAGVAMVFLGL
jgi:ABC-type nickel/cobalt efflux system permease component RcnA